MRPLCIIDPKYEGHDKKIWNSIHFLPQTFDFWYNNSITPMDFKRKIKKN
jgi:hypothetical protein